MAPARSAGWAFSPLDEELGLLKGELTPRLQESLVRLSTWMPFRRAVAELKHFTGVDLGEATARRLTQRAGAAYVEEQLEEVERLERELPPPPQGPEVQLLSVDGAYVPLVHKAKVEVKTLALGVVEAPRLEHGQQVVHTSNLSYFSRVSEARQFCREALVETYRRGTETAGLVCAVNDGAVWEQHFIDYHRPDAVRILDFSHGTSYVADAGKVVYAEETPEFKAWFDHNRHELKSGAEAQVLAEMHNLKEASAASGKPKEAAKIQDSLVYLEKRRDLIRYAEFQAKGYPIGSGSVESANKVVVESRLAQAGMHWALPHVNPILALRNIACNDRWEEAWPQIAGQQLQHLDRARAATRKQNLAQRQATSASLPAEAPLRILPTPVTSQPPLADPPAKTKQPYRPSPDHPWRHMPVGSARFNSASPYSNAKT